jgi:membrane fusion protein, multidrug efflux system
VIAALPAPAVAGGVFVPLSAAIWYADQPWAYVRRDASHFARVPLLQATETSDGYIAHGGIAAGASVVTQGAGLLLSQEQTPPPNAAPCKDPECDD